MFADVCVFKQKEVIERRIHLGSCENSVWLSINSPGICAVHFSGGLVYVFVYYVHRTGRFKAMICHTEDQTQFNSGQFNLATDVDCVFQLQILAPHRHGFDKKKVLHTYISDLMDDLQINYMNLLINNKLLIIYNFIFIIFYYLYYININSNIFHFIGY